jgi:hypothetical protein
MMRLNIGCGDRYAEGWHNVDHPGMPHRKDEALDLRNPLPWVEVEYVYAGHVLEHLRVNECLSFLPRLLRCMAPGGELMVVGPDVLRAQGMAIAGTLDVTLESLKYGAGRWPGDEHRWECESRDIMSLLQVTGWSDVREVGINNVPDMWPVADRRPQWQCAVTAKRGLS